MLCSCRSFRAGGSAGCTLWRPRTPRPWPSFHADPDRHHPPTSRPLPRGVGTKWPPGPQHPRGLRSSPSAPTVSPPPRLTLLVLLLGDHGHRHGGRGRGLAAAGQPADLERPEGALQRVFGGGRVLLLGVSLPVCGLCCRPVIHLQPHELGANALAVKDEGGSPLRPQQGTAAPRAGMGKRVPSDACAARPRGPPVCGGPRPPAPHRYRPQGALWWASPTLWRSSGGFCSGEP